MVWILWKSWIKRVPIYASPTFFTMRLGANTCQFSITTPGGYFPEAPFDNLTMQKCSMICTRKSARPLKNKLQVEVSKITSYDVTCNDSYNMTHLLNFRDFMLLSIVILTSPSAFWKAKVVSIMATTRAVTQANLQSVYPRCRYRRNKRQSRKWTLRIFLWSGWFSFKF